MKNFLLAIVISCAWEEGLQGEEQNSPGGGKPKRQANGTGKKLADSAASHSTIHCRRGGNRFGQGARPMAIYRIFRERVFEPEAVICMARAYEGALVALRLTDRQDPITEIVARKIVEIAETGNSYSTAGPSLGRTSWEHCAFHAGCGPSG